MANSTTPATMNLSIVNPTGSGAGDDEVFICILGTDPSTGNFGYLNLAVSPPMMVSPQTFTYVPGQTSQTLAQIKATQGSTISIPPIQSARIYFAINADFDPAVMVASGPTPSKTNLSLFDKLEFDTSQPGQYNINPTSVDFYGISYTVEATPLGSSVPVTVGFNQSRGTIIGAFQRIPTSPTDQQSGNLNIFPACFVTDSSNNVLRVLSPKTMALEDWGPLSDVTLATQASHFLDAYVTEHCFAPNRQFTFYTKQYSASNPDNSPYQIWAQVSADGSTMSLYMDAAMTQPYTLQPTNSNTLQPPATPWPNPDFNQPSNYHNVLGDSASEIDWGYVLIGNVAAPAQTNSVANLAAPWGTDPAAMAIMVSIDRGVAHMNEGTTAWINASNYYLGNGTGQSTADLPILYYSSILHTQSLNELAYALSYDDVYGRNSSLTFADGGNVTVTLTGLDQVTLAS